MRYGKRFTQYKLELLCCLVSYMPLAHAEGKLAVQHELLSQKGCKLSHYIAFLRSFNSHEA